MTADVPLHGMALMYAQLHRSRPASARLWQQIRVGLDGLLLRQGAGGEQGECRMSSVTLWYFNAFATEALPMTRARQDALPPHRLPQ